MAPYHDADETTINFTPQAEEATDAEGVSLFVIDRTGNTYPILT